jgi:hypothetical protein
MEVQKVTGHKTLAMLLRYTQMDVGHIVERLDATEAPTRPPGNATRSVDDAGPSGASTVPDIEKRTSLPSNVIPFMSRNRLG